MLRRRRGSAPTSANLVPTVAIMAMLGLAGCSTMNVPTQQNIEGLAPSGTVSLTETFVAGYGGGSGTLTFNGQTYPFRLIGSVIGPGGADRITASGEVYRLATPADFDGRYTQGSGAAGLSRSGEGQLWLRNNTGVIMHLYSKHGGSVVDRQGRDPDTIVELVTVRLHHASEQMGR